MVLLSVDEMYRADAAAIAGGVPGIDLMEAAGAGIARAIRRRWRPCPVVVLCGPGNNGGDGFVVARLLRERGWPVRLALLGALEKLKGDARANAERWQGDLAPLAADSLAGATLVVDALFGAGLERPIGGTVAEVVDAINARGLDCVGVDVPSGVHGDSGAVIGTAPRCRLTVTFFRRKPGHCLLPGRTLCGDIQVVDIGIPAAVLDEIQPRTVVNAPAVWGNQFPWPSPDGHKYARGHAVISGGPMTGAGRLAADAARRMGAGLATIAAPPEMHAIYASGSPGTIVTAVADDAAFEELIADERRNAVLIGPGAGASPSTRARVLASLRAGKRCVLDADAITIFQDQPEALFTAVSSPCLLTPHDGEFARLFPDLEGDKLGRARAAAARSGATVLLKGGDTVIAAPDGRAAITVSAPPTLATAGSGDVLAGMALALLAQGLEPFEAGTAAAWLHGESAKRVGHGLIAEDVIEGIPSALNALREDR